ncbi:uncharacterized protein LOC125024954 [Penaeus chinensis]|uniref:uncharacterized protein LOC125024954 n=1 Tax=Penaeus chinensis TaxID=139456 RepID=UPI001FB77C06|nr:uncharacterized protein LOC125024954 [Penaeus chinensis]
MVPSDALLWWTGILLLAPAADACVIQHSHSGTTSISDGIPGSLYLLPGQNFSLLSLTFVMESMADQTRINRTIFLQAKSVRLPNVWHRIDIFPPKNESDFPRMTIPPSNETWALICCRGHEIRELRADTRGFALWSYKCPDNSLGQLLFPDGYSLQTRYVTFIVAAVLVLVALAVTMAVLAMLRQRRPCLPPPSDTPPDCSSADGNPDDEEQTPTDASRPRTSSAVSRGPATERVSRGPATESHYLLLTSPPPIDEDEAGYVILKSNQQQKKAKTTKKTTTTGHYANIQGVAKAENVYEELRL